MKLIDKYFIQYYNHFFQVDHFLIRNFGNGNYLKMKNKGIIPSRNYEIKDSNITGYCFHGYGCGFQFRDFEIGVEFKKGKIGFTAWDFFSFLSERLADIDEDKCELYLAALVKKGLLNFDDNVFFVILSFDKK